MPSADLQDHYQDHSFLDIGRHCSSPSCNQLDFLPFQCPSCDKDFCGEHWRPGRREGEREHACEKWEEGRVDNTIPSCPLCALPIPSPPSTDPNAAMDTHLTSSCPLLNPHLASLPKPKPANECRAKGCKIKMVVPIQCEKCRERFCPKHRFDRDHSCPGRETVKAAGTGGAVGAGTGGGAKKLLGAIGGGKKTGMAGLAALRRAQQAASSSSSSKPSPSSAASASKPSTAASKPSLKPPPGAPGSASNPLVLDSSDSDVEILPPKNKSKPSVAGAGAGTKVLASSGALGKGSKRAMQEQESARKALEMRAKKGLLTEDEKVRYATLQAMAQKNGGKGSGDGCVMA